LQFYFYDSNLITRSFKTNIDKSACFMADFFCQKIEKSIKF